MASVYIVRRVTKTKGVRWHVRCELSDARMAVPRLVAQPDGSKRVEWRTVIHLGSYDTEARAKAKRKAALDELAQGVAPSKLPPLPERTTTVGEQAEAWLGTLHDLNEHTVKAYKQIFGTLPSWLLGLEPASVTHLDVQALVTELARTYKRGTLERHISIVRQALDYAGVDPNPTRDRRVRLPRAPRSVYRLPTRRQLIAMHDAMPARSELMTLLEHTGLRIQEAAALCWRDIDERRGRLLVADAKTAAGVRWVHHLEHTPPFPTRPPGADPDGRIFTRPSPDSLTGMIRVAHQRHRTFLMSAHEFRHLHASRLLHDGILSPAQIAARLGHANPAITLKIYAHVVPPED